MKKAVFLFNKTNIMPQPWVDAGYECWMFDGQHDSGVHRDKENPNIVRVGMWFYADRPEQLIEIAHMVGEGVEIVVSFAECTYLTTTGARWFYHPDDKHLPVCERRPHPSYPNRKKDRENAVELAKMVENLANYLGKVPWMLENPAVSNLNTMWRRPDYKFNPYEYGGYLPEDDTHPEYPKNYPPRDAYNKNTGIWCGNGFVMPEKLPVEPVPGDFHQVTKGGGKTTKTKNMRSCTPRGFARAVFEANH